MPRYRLIIEYDGTPYVGWQRQENGSSVQGAVEKAILSLTGETVSIRGAGRTDSGVHAMGQVAHVDLARAWKEHTTSGSGRSGHVIRRLPAGSSNVTIFSVMPLTG